MGVLRNRLCYETKGERPVLRCQSGGLVMKSLRRFLSRLGHFVTKRRDGEPLREEIPEYIALHTPENLRAAFSPAQPPPHPIPTFPRTDAATTPHHPPLA